MEVYTQPDIEKASAFLKSDAIGTSFVEDKENVAPCGTFTGHRAHLSDSMQAKTQVLTRSVLEDVTYQFPVDNSAASAPRVSADPVQNSNLRRQNTEEQIARNTTAAAHRLRLMR